MAKAVKKVKGGDWGFPAEIIAAAYGWGSLGTRVSGPPFAPQLIPYPPSGTVNREVTGRAVRIFLEKLSQAKRRASAEETPLIVAVDIPGLGPHLYDANLIRDLVRTEIIPHSVRIRSYKVDSVLVPYLMLENKPAELAQSCFEEAASSDQLGCPNKIKPVEQKKVQSRSVPFALGFVSGAPGEPRSQEPVSEPGDLIKLLAELPNRDKAGLPITISLNGNCTPLAKISDEDRRQWNLPPMPADTRACLLTFMLYLPPKATHSYGTISVFVEIKPEDAYVYCGPPQLAVGTIIPEITPICPVISSSITWILSDKIMRQVQPTPQNLRLLVRPVTSSKSTLRLLLTGKAYLAKPQESKSFVMDIP